MRHTKKGRRSSAITCGAKEAKEADEAFVCRHGRTATDKCINDFEDQTGFTFIDAEPDRNSFFHTLAMYYGFKHINRHAISKHDHTELRMRVIRYMMNHDNECATFGIIQDDIEKMEENGIWNCDIDDLIPHVAAAALNLHIHLYVIVPGTRNPYSRKRIVLHRYPKEEGIPEDTIHVLRMNTGHYGLLLPSI